MLCLVLGGREEPVHHETGRRWQVTGALMAVSCASDSIAHRGGLELGPANAGLGHGVAGPEVAALPALPVLQEKPSSEVFLGQPFP